MNQNKIEERALERLWQLRRSGLKLKEIAIILDTKTSRVFNLFSKKCKRVTAAEYMLLMSHMWGHNEN